MSNHIKILIAVFAMSLTLASCQTDNVNGTLIVKVETAAGISSGSVYLKKDTLTMPNTALEQYEYTATLSSLHEAVFRDLLPAHYVIYTRARDAHQNIVQAQSTVTIYGRHQMNDYLVALHAQ